MHGVEHNGYEELTLLGNNGVRNRFLNTSEGWRNAQRWDDRYEQRLVGWSITC